MIDQSEEPYPDPDFLMAFNKVFKESDLDGYRHIKLASD